GRPGAPAEMGSHAQGGAPHEGARSAPPPRPPLPPRRPRREPPKPKLTQAALEGKVPLRTFSELSALFAAKKDKDAAPPAAAPVAVAPAPLPEPAGAAPLASPTEGAAPETPVADTPPPSAITEPAPSAVENPQR